MIIERFIQQVEKQPAQIAVKTESGSLTYNELNVFSQRIAGGIKALQSNSQNPGAAHHIGLLFDSGLDMIAAILGVLKSGSAYVPLVKDYPPKRIEYIAAHAEIDVFITDKNNLDMAAKAVNNKNIRFITVEEIADAPVSMQFNPAADGDRSAYLLYTSGSTGRPKGVVQTQRNILYFIDRYIENLNLSSADRITHFPVFTHDASVVDLYSALLSGASLFPLDLKKGDRFGALAQWLAQEEITVFHSVPTVFRYFIAGLREAPHLPLLRYIVLGGEAVFKSDVERFSSLFPQACLYNLYGQTESTYNSGQFFYPGQPVGDITLGQVNKGTQIFLIDEAGSEVEPLEVGEIVVAGAHISPGYFKAEEETTAKFIEDEENGRFYFTGDLGRLLRDGRIEYVERKDNQVKVRGFRVELGEIENVVLSYPDITAAAAVPITTEAREIFIACYFSAVKKIELDELRDFLGQSLADYMIPSYFKQLQKLPLTVSNKVDRNALPAPEVTIGEEYRAPATEVEKKLAEIWSGILEIGKEVIGLDSNFFALGGHSLRATVLTLAIYKELQVKVPLQEVFNRPTIRRLAAYIEQAGKSEYEEITPAEKKEFYPLSSPQKRMYMLQQLNQQGAVYNILNFFNIGDQADKQKIEAACIKLLQRHEMLRTSFHIIGQEPVQKIHDPQDVEFALDYFELTSESIPGAAEPGTAPGRQPDWSSAAEQVVEKFLRPFALDKAPLFRAALAKVNDYYAFVVDFHHIIVDNMALNSLLDDYLKFYNDSELPALKLHSKDYFLWQTGKRQKAGLKKMEEYWLSMLAGELPVLDLPYDYPRPALQSFEGKTVGVIIEAEETRRLKELAQQTDTTLYMLLLAALNILLTRLSSQEEILIGVPAAGRMHDQARDLIGMFVNTVVVRNFPAPGKPFRHFLQEVKQNLITAYENQDYPFEEVVEKVSQRRDVGRNPLFDISFNLINQRDFQGDIVEAVERNEVVYRRETSRFDITYTVIDRGQKLVFRFEYSTRLFKEETMDRIIGYLKNIMRQLYENPHQTVGEIGILSAAEKNRLLYEFNDTFREYPAEKTIQQLFVEQAGVNPDRIALLGPAQVEIAGRRLDDAEKPALNVSVTYRKLDELSGRLANVLSGKSAAVDSVIGIMIERSIEMIVGILGILKSGGAYLPLETNFPPGRIRYMLLDSGAKLLVATPGSFDRELHINDWEGEVVFIDESSGDSPGIRWSSGSLCSPAGFPTVPLSRGVAYIIYTSGTSGNPKGVLTQHYNVTRVVRNTNYIEITPQDNVLQLSNYAFDGSVFDIYGALLNGAKLVLAVQSDIFAVDRLGQLIRREGITAFFITSSLFNTIVDLEIESLAGVRKVIPGGERLSPEHTRRALQYLGKGRIINGYGPTETTVFAIYYFIDEIDDNAVAIPIGKPLANTEVYILDRNLQLLPIGVKGEIYIGGCGNARGYLNNPELTAEKFIAFGESEPFCKKVPTPPKTFIKSFCGGPGGDFHEKSPLAAQNFYKTGDLARWLPNGIIEYLGRIDHQVKIRGFRIELGEIERRMLEIESIKEAVAVVKENNSGEKRLCAYIVSDGEPNIPAIKEQLAKKLPNYMIPSYFTGIERVPLTQNGKVNYRALPVIELDEAGDNYIPPRNEKEEKLAAVWQDVLRLKKIGITDNFFELGGDSIKAIQLVARLKKYGLELKINDLFLYPTIEQVVKCTKEQEGMKKIDQGIISGQVHLTPIQTWFVSNKFTHSHHFNQAMMLYRPTGFDSRLVRDLLTKVVDHHDALRMVFRPADSGEIIQWNRALEEPLFDLIEKDLTGELRSEIEAAVRQAANRLQRSIDLEKGPLLKAELFKTRQGDHLLLVAHHLVVDGVSWRILQEDIAAGYAQLERGEEIIFPAKTCSFKHWAEEQVAYAYSRTLLNELDYWRAIEAKEYSHIESDFKKADKRNDHSQTLIHYLFFSETETRALLRDVNQAYNTEINDILLAALGLAVKEWRGLEEIVINLEGHGREEIDAELDISRTIGWFTAQFPVVLDMRRSGDISYTIKSVKETLRKIPNKGIGYGILKYLTPVHKLDGIKFRLEPQIGFNYLGQFDVEGLRGDFQVSSLPSGNFISPQMERFRYLDISGLTRRGELVIMFNYSKDEFSSSSIERLAENFRSCLLGVIDHCAGKEEKELTPADLDYGGELSIDRLAELEDRFAQIDIG